MPWIPLSADHPPQLRPRPADRPYVLTYTDGALGFPALALGDLVLPVPDAPGVFYPVMRQEGQLGYDADWRVALAIDAGIPSRTIRTWLQADPSPWLALHPDKGLPAWALALDSDWRDGEIVACWREIPMEQVQQAAREWPLLEVALKSHRPHVADWLWDQGIRPDRNPRHSLLALAIELDPFKAWIHLGGAVEGRNTSYQPDGWPKTDAQLSRIEGTVKTPYRGMDVSALMTHMAQTWQTRLQGQGLPMEGPGFDRTYHQARFNGQAERTFVIHHTAASLLLGGMRWENYTLRVAGETLSAVQQGWAHWLDRQGLRWADAGPRIDGEPREGLPTFLSRQLTYGNTDAWQAWVRERDLAQRPAPPAHRPRRRA